MNELHAPLARAIRDGVRLRYSEEIRTMLLRGGEVFMNGGEADDAAQAALGWLDANGYVIIKRPVSLFDLMPPDRVAPCHGETCDDTCIPDCPGSPCLIEDGLCLTCSAPTKRAEPAPEEP